MQKQFFGAVVLATAVVTAAVIFFVRGQQLARQEAQDAQVLSTIGEASEYPPLTNPVFVAPAAMDNKLGDELLGVDVEVGGDHRFYSAQILNWHYVVNDTFNGKRLVVTYDVLTGAAVVYETERVFHATGKIDDNAMVLVDETGAAIDGSLAVYPSMLTTWGAWFNAYPDGDVLSSDTGVARDYTRHPFGGYDSSFTVYYPISVIDTRLDGPKTRVFGVVFEGTAFAFPLPALQTAGEVEVQGLKAVYDEQFNVVRVFSGEQELTTTPMFWFAWASAHPGTVIADGNAQE